MDPISASVLAALAGGAGGEAGRQLWQGLALLVRRPFRRGDDGRGADGSLDPGSGQAELSALDEAPADVDRAHALVTALQARAALDAEFRGLLAEWWRRAQSVDAGGIVHSHISGGTQNGPVMQGRDFSNITFTVPPPAPPATPPSA
ncbi:hypothetical protein AB0K09_05585 [Streptomyces sp. NPDC049577]|uniref:hypothetical protein n=1 Tax=Streptomyces sp. NPDC049577 TaxID=3155153 RepID=UPI003449538D